MPGRHVMIVLALGASAACSGERSGQSPSKEAAGTRRPSAVADAAPTTTSRDTGAAISVVQSGEAAIPKFVAGTYELVLDRDEAVFDDSLAATDYVERRLAWDAVDSAQDWRDSLSVVDALFKRALADEYEHPERATTADSTKVSRRMLEGLRCIEWRAGATVTLDIDGRFTREADFRMYCRGSVPPYTRRTVSEPPSALETCQSWEAPVPATVPHLTCRFGLWWNGSVAYRYVGDTLKLASDCDGSETYVLRLPDRSPAYAVARSSDVSRLEEC